MIARDFEAAATETYDLVVVGGGVYGVALTLEAARRGLRPILLERDDFGSQTSWNSLRIVHGGLRYLQQLDLRRFRQSVNERAWFLTHFPDLVQPLECLMPLYGKGLKRPSTFRAALAANEILSWGRLKRSSGDRLLPYGRVLSRQATLEKFPLADKEQLEGGALWFDAIMPMPHRLMIEMLHWATACGATALNYAEAIDLPLAESRLLGVQAVDRITGRPFVFKAPVVVNTSGPWCREVAGRLDRQMEGLHQISLAFNVLLDLPEFSNSALALEPKKPNPRTYFFVPVDGRVLVGTFHSSWPRSLQEGQVFPRWVDELLADLSLVLPGTRIGRQHVLRVDWGFLPTDTRGSAKQSRHPIVVHHHDAGGIQGLFSVSGVKFTTARLVAEKTLRKVQAYLDQGSRRPNPQPRPPGKSCLSLAELRNRLEEDKAAVAKDARRLVELESVVHLDDLMLRRTGWAADPVSAHEVARQVAPLLGWDDEKVSEETRRFEALSDGIET